MPRVVFVCMTLFFAQTSFSQDMNLDSMFYQLPFGKGLDSVLQWANQREELEPLSDTGLLKKDRYHYRVINPGKNFFSDSVVLEILFSPRNRAKIDSTVAGPAPGSFLISFIIDFGDRTGSDSHKQSFEIAERYWMNMLSNYYGYCYKQVLNDTLGNCQLIWICSKTREERTELYFSTSRNNDCESQRRKLKISIVRRIM